jgi:hypothetical protein
MNQPPAGHSATANATDRAARHRELGLAAVPDDTFDQLAKDLGTRLNAGAAMVNLIGTDQQYFTGLYGRPAEAGGRAFLDNPGRTMDMHEGFCVDVLERPIDLALPLDDVCATPRYFNNAVVTKMGVRSYIGVALVDDDGTRIGTVCAIDRASRSPQDGTSWGIEGVRILKEVRDRVMAEIRSRQAISELIDGAPGPVMITAVPGHELLLINTQHAEVFGQVSRLGTPAGEQYPTLAQHGVLDTLTQHAATGRPAATEPIQIAPSAVTAVFATVPAAVPGHPHAALTLGMGAVSAQECITTATILARSAHPAP